MDIRKHYPKDWVVLQNRVAECFRGMSLDEKRLFIMATPWLEQLKFLVMTVFSFHQVTSLKSVELTYQRLIPL